MAGSTPALEVHQLAKSYATVQAVNNLSFTVMPGEIFGLLGPNGAGKTTTIRMILDIIKPTSGSIQVLGGPMTEATKARIGYLPEERGLYEDMTLLDTVLFLGQLKGLSRATARERAERYLRQVNLWEVRQRKIGAMSRGMNQKAQFVSATLHEPELLIIDEPFSGLDPVNARMLKDLLYMMRERGTAIIMSSHQMHQVEAMCERLLLIDRGRQVLYGPLPEIRRQFAANAVEVELRGELPPLAEVEAVTPQNGAYRLLLKEGIQPELLLKTLVNLPTITVERFERVEPSLDDIFIQVVGRPVSEAELGRTAGAGEEA
ncbi:MAG: ATP-binding cassette domain-containing protein [Caldilineaceae bacterium]|nr:ATP-binding cassette domain-containing protein [Caldilineaceae bacterium]